MWPPNTTAGSMPMSLSKPVSWRSKISMRTILMRSFPFMNMPRLKMPMQLSQTSMKRLKKFPSSSHYTNTATGQMIAISWSANPFTWRKIMKPLRTLLNFTWMNSFRMGKGRPSKTRGKPSLQPKAVKGKVPKSKKLTSGRKNCSARGKRQRKNAKHIINFCASVEQKDRARTILFAPARRRLRMVPLPFHCQMQKNMSRQLKN